LSLGPIGSSPIIGNLFFLGIMAEWLKHLFAKQKYNMNYIMGSSPIYSDIGISPSGKAMVFDIISIGSNPIILKFLTIKMFWEPIIWNSNFLNIYFRDNIFYLMYFIGLGYIIFFGAIMGFFLYRQSLFFSLLFIELILVSINFIFLLIGNLLLEPFCYILVLYLLTLAAAETVLGMTLLLLYYRITKTSMIQILIKNDF
jgi:NADH-quinone oxidoreductase subunit K